MQCQQTMEQTTCHGTLLQKNAYCIGMQQVINYFKCMITYEEGVMTYLKLLIQN